MGPFVPRSVFHAGAYPSEKRIEAYRESMGVIFDVAEIETRGTFDARIQTHLISDLMLVDCHGVGQKFLRPSSRIARDGMDHFLVQLFLHGATMREGDDPVVCRPKQMIVIDTARPWRAYNPDFRNLTLVVPRRLVCGRLLDENGHHGRLLDPRGNPFADLLYSHVLGLHRTIGAVERELAHSMVAPSVDLFVAALNQASHAEGGRSADPLAAGARVLRTQIRDYIEENLGDPSLRVATLQKKFKLTRSTLYRLFPSSDGVMEYVRDRRMKAAFKRLAMPRAAGESVAEIAFGLGFENETSFTRAFKNHFGLTPREVKRGRDGAHFRPDLGPHRSWEAWLRSL